jgi:hypothetical protein
LIDARRLEQMIASLQETDNPFGPILRGDTGVTSAELVGRLDEMDAFARTYGFRDHDEYLQVWLRVTLVEMSDVAAELDELAAQAATQIEARLRDPALTEAQRMELTRKLGEARAEIETDNVTLAVDPIDDEVVAGGPEPAPPVGGAARARSRPSIDLELIRAHRGELSAALARWR